MTAVEVLDEWDELEPELLLCAQCYGWGCKHSHGVWVACPRCNGTGIEPERSET